MIASDTSRTRAYLQALARNDLLPNFVLVLEPSSNDIRPGQVDKTKLSHEITGIVESNDCWSEAKFDATRSITSLLDEYGTNYKICKKSDINDPEAIEIIRHRPESVFIYSGFGGIIVNSEVLSAGKKFLHVHGGYLPDYKGSTTNYYSLITENNIGATAIFLSEKLDSGPILLRRKFPPPANRRLLDHIYDAGARAKVLVETLDKYLRNGEWIYELAENIGGETYYIVHPVLKHIAILGKDQ